MRNNRRGSPAPTPSSMATGEPSTRSPRGALQQASPLRSNKVGRRGPPKWSEDWIGLCLQAMPITAGSDKHNPSAPKSDGKVGYRHQREILGRRQAVSSEFDSAMRIGGVLGGVFSPWPEIAGISAETGRRRSLAGNFWPFRPLARVSGAGLRSLFSNFRFWGGETGSTVARDRSRNALWVIGHDAATGPAVKGSKNDATDAEGIYEAATRPTMRFGVPGSVTNS
jgi:hypothetical protein